MEPAQRGRQTDGDAQKLRQLQRLLKNSIEGLATRDS
jgi:hypothetical protein